MSPRAPPVPPPASASPWFTLTVAGVLALSAALAYHHSFTAPFAFDDTSAIIKNPTIRDLWAIGRVLSPPNDAGGVCGRPLVNLSLAINYAVSGQDVWSYHALNLLIHLLAALTLYGVMRRTLLQPALQCRFAAMAPWLALAVAGLWLLHPLQTEAVTFVVQRNEALMGLFYLLTLYAFIRGSEEGASSRWLIVSVVSCLLGMTSKEVMVSAPLLVLLYDRTFGAGSFRAAWYRRRGYYAALAASWLLLGWLMAGSHQRGGTVGFGLGVTPRDYALTQCRAIVHYLRLSFWPHPLVVDYGSEVVTDFATVVPQGLLLLALLAGTVMAWWRWPAVGFAGAWFFAILAPSSSVVPLTTQTMAEHRMYLPLAAVIALLVVGIHAAFGRKSLAVYSALAVAAILVTARRNDDYRSAVTLWSATVADRPANPRAHYNLGLCLLEARRLTEAAEQFETALQLRPSYAEAQNNLGNALWALGRATDAAPHYEAALQLNPASAEAHNNVGNVRLMAGQTAEAIACYREALRLDPGYFEARSDLGYALLIDRQPAEAASQLEQALRLNPASAEAHNNLGEVLRQLGRPAEAADHFRRALALKPGYAKARENLDRLNP